MADWPVVGPSPTIRGTLHYLTSVSVANPEAKHWLRHKSDPDLNIELVPAVGLALFYVRSSANARLIYENPSDFITQYEFELKERVQHDPPQRTS